ncbi:MAG: hypothetical protein Q4C53_09490 [Clostridia bacterium]|nr:hypothetical protein [Clostridia bacterium]
MCEKVYVTDVLCAIAKGYETGDFGSLFPYLAKDCVFESQWVRQPNNGCDEVVAYLEGKGRTLRRNRCFAKAFIVKLRGNGNPVAAGVSVNGAPEERAKVSLWYPDGEHCLLLRQELPEETVELIVRVQLQNDKVARIDLCMPELFRYDVVLATDDIANNA